MLGKNYTSMQEKAYEITMSSYYHVHRNLEHDVAVQIAYKDDLGWGGFFGLGGSEQTRQTVDTNMKTIYKTSKRKCGWV